MTTTLDDDYAEDGDLLDSDATISLDDPELEDVEGTDGLDSDGGGYSDDGEIPFDPFALNQSEEALEFWADDAEGFDVEGDPHEVTADVSTPSIDEGDFLDPAMRFLFIRLKKRIREACNVNTKVDVRRRALDWIFVPSSRDKDSLEFDLTCQALGARPMIVRARTMHQLWRASIMLSDPLSFLSVIPPTTLMSEIDARIGPGPARQLAREIWYWPSIPIEALRAEFAEMESRTFHAALTSLDALGYVATTFGRVYFISRNPTILSVGGRNRFAFAPSIIGDN